MKKIKIGMKRVCGSAFVASFYRVFCYVCAVYVAVCMAGCDRGNDGSDRGIRPVFKNPHVTVVKGEELMNPVVNASEVLLVSAPECVEACVEGCGVLIRGLSGGEGEIMVSADGQRVRCGVTVVDISVPGGDVPDEDVERELEDGSTRVVSADGGVSRLSEPGNMFVLSSDGMSLSVFSLATGEETRFCAGVDLSVWEIPESGLPAALPGALLAVNGEECPLASACVMRNDGGRIWIRLLTEGGKALWIVMAQDFAS